MNKQSNRKGTLSGARQQGASAIGLIIILAVIGYGAYVGIQYIPQRIEYSTLEAIMENINRSNNKSRFFTRQALEKAISKQLNVNVMDDHRDNFEVSQDGSTLVVNLSYERDLNLLYEQKKIQYKKTLFLE
jgi:nitric oxide reductase large subunit